MSFLFVQGGTFISGNEDFDSEKLLAYELGYRTQISDDLYLDLAAYYNDYGDIRTAEVGSVPLPTPPYPPGTLPAPFDNKAEAVAYGFEIGASWQVLDQWTLSGRYTLMNVDVNLPTRRRCFVARSSKRTREAPRC